MKRSFIAVSFFLMFALVLSLAGCGGATSSSDGDTSHLALYDSSGATLQSVSVTASQSSVPPSVPVYLAYSSSVATIFITYPTGGVNPQTYGINLQQVTTPPSNPLAFSMSFNTNRTPGTYQATWRFVAVDGSSNVLTQLDLPVTFTVN